MRRLFVAICLLATRFCLGQNLVINGAVVYASPESKPLVNALVIIKNGKIASVGKQGEIPIPPNVEVIAGKGLFLTAGYWNSHVHFTESKWSGADTISAARLKAQLTDMVTSRGFTHVFDVGELDFSNLKALRARIEKGEIPGPSIRAVGVPVTSIGGSPFYIRPIKLLEAGNKETAIKDVTDQFKAGAQGLKLFTGPSNGKEVVPMKVDVAVAAVQTAHRYRLPVFAHPGTEVGVNVALAAGVDVLAHVAPDTHHEWSPALIQSLIKKNIAVIPTLKLFQWSLPANGANAADDPLITTALQQIGAFSKAGGVVLFGTDVGFMSDYSTTAEFELLSRAGLRFADILTSLTTAPAQKFGFGTTSGRIAKGFDADLVLLSADPMADSRNFSQVAYTIVKGKVIYRHP